MKILDMKDAFTQIEGGEPYWNSSLTVLGDYSPDAYEHMRKYHHVCVECRIAEYDMDPLDIDSVLHLILHEHLFNKRNDINCYTPGYTQKTALAYRLQFIDDEIRRHEVRMTTQHRGMIRYQPHKHPGLDPVREKGIDAESLHIRRLQVEGTRLKLDGRKHEGNARLVAARELLMARGSK